MHKYLLALLRQCDIPTEDCAFVYLLGDEQPAGTYGRPTAAQLRRLAPGFRDQVRDSRAQAMLLMGPHVFRHVTGLEFPIDSIRGYVIHPADMRPTSMMAEVCIGEYKRDNKRKGIKAGDPRYAIRKVPADPPLPMIWSERAFDTAINSAFVVPSLDMHSLVKQRKKPIQAVLSAMQVMKEYADGAPLIDYEFNYTESIGDGEIVPPAEACVFDLEGYDAIERFSVAVVPLGVPSAYTLEWNGDTKRFLQDALHRCAIRVAHNIAFDAPFLARNGVTVPEPWFDTMLAANLLEPELPKALGSVAPIYLRTKPWKHLSTLKGYADPFYSAKDAFITAHLYIALVEELKKWDMLDLFTQRIMPAVPTLIALKQGGVRVDPVAADEWCRQLEQQLEKEMHRWFGHFPDVNPNSTRDVQKLLYTEWKLPVQRTKTEGVTVNELALVTLRSIAPSRAEPISWLLEIRRLSKLLSTYARPAREQRFVNPSYLPAGKDFEHVPGQYGKGAAATGRLATSGPNIQNQPKEARTIYIPDDDGMVFIEADWSQAELRIMAAHADDHELQLALMGDVHARTMQLLGCDRTRAKNVIYGTSYGAGPRKLVEVMRQNGVSVTEQECRDLQQALAVAYPRWWAWRNYVAAVGKSQGFLRNAFGRLRRFRDPMNDVSSMMDFIPQSEVADIGWSSYRAVDVGFRALGGRLTTVVHDSFLGQVPADRVDAAADMLRDILERRYDEVAPEFYIPIDIKCGTNWGRMDQYANRA